MENILEEKQTGNFLGTAFCCVQQPPAIEEACSNVFSIQG